MPLPKELSPSPFGIDCTFNVRRNVCPCAHFLDHVGLKDEASPFCGIRGGRPHQLEMAREALKRTEAFDADEGIMVIMAHDWTLLGVMDFWPQSANGWREKEWKERGRWEFLKDLVNIEQE